MIRPSSIRLEASTVCQLECPSCPNASGEIAKFLGRGFLRFEDFKSFIDRNPVVSQIELSNWGEIFLNTELIPIIHYAFRKNVALSASNGVNLNDVPEAVLEALVKYKFRAITCSIDGADSKTYSIYRINGDLSRVLNNIRRINTYKKIHRSPYPALVWQFIPFGHNEHEIGIARRIAVDLNMEFALKLSWEDLYGRPFSPVIDTALVRRESGVGAASRNEYRTTHRKEYALRNCFCCMWKTPQINYDGRVLGCSVNYWGDYGNAFQEGFLECVNNDRVSYAREMLMGNRGIAEGIPCGTCPAYLMMKDAQSWLTPHEVKENFKRSRILVMLENRRISKESIHQLAQLYRKIKALFGRQNGGLS